VERIPETTPLEKRCLGTELDLADPVCQGCHLQARCRELHGRRATRVRLSKASFKLAPPKLEAIRERIEDPDAPVLAELYKQCHLTVFGAMPPDRLKPQAEQAVHQLTRELNCSARVAITTVMMSQKAKRPDAEFYSMMLAGKNAERCVTMYRDACRKEFGFFDVSSIDVLTKDKTFTLEDRLINSETIFGEFVVGYKMRVGGEPFTEFYRIKEHALDPIWLAIEPTYQEVLEAHIQDPTGTAVVRQHRHAVIQARKLLIRSKGQALFTFQAREKIVPGVVRTVLSRRGFRTSNFLVESPISDMGKIWSRLGTAIQHINVLRFIDGDLSAIRELVSYS